MSTPDAQQSNSRGASLADKFEQINGEVVAFVRACPAEQWQSVTDSEGWPLAVVAQHIAASYRVIGSWVRTLAAGQPVAMTMDDINAGNEQMRQHAQSHPDAYAQEGVIAALERNAAETSALVRALTDAQLDSQAHFGPAGRPLTAEQVIKYVLFVHPRDHLASMRAALGQSAS